MAHWAPSNISLKSPSSDWRSRKESGGGASASCSPSKKTTLKTPFALLHQICVDGNFTLTVPFEQEIEMLKPGQPRFKCAIEVTTPAGVYTGVGVSHSKKGAKHAAARDALFQMDPGICDELDPEFCDSLDLVVYGQNEVGMYAKKSPGRGRPRGLMNGAVASLERGAVVGTANAVEVQGDTRDVIVTQPQSDKLMITIRLPDSLSQPPTNDLQNLTLQEKIEVVKDWEGPKITKLKGYTTDQVYAIKKPVMAVDQITYEQNLKSEFVSMGAEEEDGNVKHSCILEVTPQLPLSGTQHRSPVQFTAFGMGDSFETAQDAAAKNFLEMIRTIVNIN